MFTKPTQVFLALVLTSLSAYGQSAVNGLAAVVNGKVITKSEVRDAVNAQEQMLRMKHRDDPAAFEKEMRELRETALDSLIDRELILSEFAKIGGVIKPQYVEDDINGIIRESFKGDRDAFVTELARTGMTMKKFRELREKMIIVQVMRGRYAGGQPPATPREVNDFYQKNNENYREKDMLKISTITIPKFTGDADAGPAKQKKIADEIRSKIVAGGDFATMAKTYSQDSRAENGGEWDWMERKQMKKSLADTAFNLKSGGVSPVLDDETSYIIIYLDAKKLGDATPLEKVRPDIERIIDQEKGKASLDKWLAELRRKAVIKKMELGTLPPIRAEAAPPSAVSN